MEAFGTGAFGMGLDVRSEAGKSLKHRADSKTAAALRISSVAEGLLLGHRTRDKSLGLVSRQVQEGHRHGRAGGGKVLEKPS